MATRATATAMCFATACASSINGSSGRKLSFLLGDSSLRAWDAAQIIAFDKRVACTA